MSVALQSLLYVNHGKEKDKMGFARLNDKGEMEVVSVGRDGKVETKILGLAHMCGIAKSRLSSKEILSVLYIDNDAAPQPLREIMKLYVDGKLTQEETAQKLDELAAMNAR